MTDIKKSDICCCCGLYVKSFLCPRHRKRYIYYPEHNFIALKPRRKISKGQTRVFKILREIYKKPCFQEVIFPWNLFYRYDIVIPEYKTIIEYDGRQHFAYVAFFHKDKEDFERMKKRDKEKENIAKSNGWKVIRVNYKEKDSFIKRKLKCKIK